MTLTQIFERAVRLIAEDPTHEDCSDLRARAVDMICVISEGLLPLHRAEIGDREAVLPIPAELEGEYPASDGIAMLCTLKLAYLYAADENTALYAVLKNEYEGAKNEFIASLEGSVGKITDVYS